MIEGKQANVKAGLFVTNLIEVDQVTDPSGRFSCTGLLPRFARVSKRPPVEDG
jgi:hypothetical protein